MRFFTFLLLLFVLALSSKNALARGEFARVPEHLRQYQYERFDIVGYRPPLSYEVYRYFYPRYQFRRTRCYYDGYLHRWHRRGHIRYYGRSYYPCWRRDPRYRARRHYWK